MEVVTKEVNNLEINIINTEKFKLVNVQISFLFNLDYDDIAAYNLLLNMLITRNKMYPSIKEFSLYLENNYGMNINGGYFNRGNVGVFNLTSRAINSKYSLNENMLKIQVDTLKDCLFNPLLTQESLDEIKLIYSEKLKEKLNKKPYILKKKVNKILGNDNPYGINIEGDIDSINNVSLDKIKEVYNKLITSGCKIYVCGSVNEEEVLNLFSEFKLIKNNEALLNLNYIYEIKESEINVFDSNFLQSSISLTYECNITYKDKLYYALKVFLEMLNYDLYHIIREQYNFCYYMYAISNNYLNTIEIVSEIESKNLDKIIELINEIISNYSNNFNHEQFDICKDKIFTYIKNSLDNPRDIIELEFGFDFNKNSNSISELENNYKNVTCDDVKEVAKMVSLKMVSILKEVSNNG